MLTKKPTPIKLSKSKGSAKLYTACVDERPFQLTPRRITCRTGLHLAHKINVISGKKESSNNNVSDRSTFRLSRFRFSAYPSQLREWLWDFSESGMSEWNVRVCYQHEEAVVTGLHKTCTGSEGVDLAGLHARNNKRDTTAGWVRLSKTDQYLFCCTYFGLPTQNLPIETIWIGFYYVQHSLSKVFLNLTLTNIISEIAFRISISIELSVVRYQVSMELLSLLTRKILKSVSSAITQSVCTTGVTPQSSINKTTRTMEYSRVQLLWRWKGLCRWHSLSNC